MSIPASRIVTINPSAIGTGGNPLAMNTLLIVSGPERTIGVQQFGSAAEVGAFYGLTSPEYTFAGRYFLGYDGATKVPDAIYTVEDPAAPLPAILRGASVRTMTLTQLKAITGTLTVTIDGTPITITPVFSAVTSFSEAAALLTDVTNFVGDYNEQQQCFEISTIDTGATANISFGSGAVGLALKLDQASGAQKENGRAVMTDAELMAYVLNRTQNFGVITHVAEQLRADKESMAAWVTLQNSRFAYIAQDTDGTALVANNDASFGKWLEDTEQNGTTPYYGSIEQVAAVCGGIAAIDFKRTNGRRNIMFMKQAGLAATITEEGEYTALMSNGYTFYGEFATANDEFRFNVNGAVSGQFKWLDNYVNQIYLNAQFQLAMMIMLQAYGFISYNETGKAIHRAAAADPIKEMINFGGIVPLIDPSALSEQQKSIINTQAGYSITPSLLSQGWAIDIKTPDAQTRGNRGSFPFTFWYTDGGSVQSVNMASINVQ
jgi:hypothetical protein